MTKISTRQRLIKRLDAYYKMEGFNAIWIFAASVYVIFKQDWQDILFFTYGIWLMVYILIQGTWYWKLKLNVLKKESVSHEKEICRFERFKKYNSIYIGLIPFVLALQLYFVPDIWTHRNLFYGSIFVNVFAVLEHINYYYFQLMYDNPYDWKYLKRNKRLKPASLKKDIRDRRF